MKAELALCCVMLTACGGATGAGRTAPAGAAPRDENVITEDELRSRSSFNLYDAIRALRPRWLRRNPTALRPSAESDIVVYVDRARMGGLAALRDILPSEAQLVRYYSPSQAEAEFGPGHLHGAIQVITSRVR